MHCWAALTQFFWPKGTFSPFLKVFRILQSERYLSIYWRSLNLNEKTHFSDEKWNRFLCLILQVGLINAFHVTPCPHVSPSQTRDAQLPHFIWLQTHNSQKAKKGLTVFFNYYIQGNNERGRVTANWFISRCTLTTLEKYLLFSPSF